MRSQRSLKHLPFSLLLFLPLACSDSGGSSEQGKMFSDISSEAGLTYETTPETSVDRDKESGGVGMEDLNGDGYLDLFVAHGTHAKGRMFLNNGDGTFQDITTSSQINTTTKARGALFLDVDMDGRNDLLVIEGPPENLLIYQNNGNNTFTDITASSSFSPTGNSFSIAAGDYDKDDDLDIAIAQYSLRPNSGAFESWLWENQSGTYVDQTSSLPIPVQLFDFSPGVAADYQWNFTPTFGDVNDDGSLDLLFAANYTNSTSFLGDGAGGFAQINPGVFTDEGGMGSALGDYDNDGDLDWFVSSIWHPDKTFDNGGVGNSGNRLYQNNGAGSFTDVTDQAWYEKIRHFQKTS